MTDNHDPMCPVPDLIKQGKTVAAASCKCEEYARVREDERASATLAALTQDAAVKAYAAAVSDAVEAVSRTCGHTKYEGCPPCPHDDAVAAIEALGGEQ